MITDARRRTNRQGYQELKSPYDATNKRIPRRTLLTWAGVVIVMIIILITLFNVGDIDATTSESKSVLVESWNKSHSVSEISTPKEIEPWDSLSVLKGPPTAKFRGEQPHTTYSRYHPHA